VKGPRTIPKFNEIYSRRKYTQMVTRSKRREVKIVNNNGLYVVFTNTSLNTSMWIHQKPINGH